MGERQERGKIPPRMSLSVRYMTKGEMQKMNVIGADYKSEYADRLLEYFRSYPREAAERPGKGGRAELPSLALFCKANGIYLLDLERWRGEREEFSIALREAEEYRRALVLDGVLSGEINPSAAKFFLDEVGEKESGDGQGSFLINVCYEEVG